MPLLCPDCQTPRLEGGHAVELPADAESDEISLAVLRCRGCGLLALGLYEESHRGSSDDCWRHGGWRSDRAEADRVEGLITACTDRTRRGCGCENHRALTSLKDDLRRRDGRFPVRHVPRDGTARP